MLLLPLVREEDATLSSVVALLVYVGLKKQKAGRPRALKRGSLVPLLHLLSSFNNSNSGKCDLQKHL